MKSSAEEPQYLPKLGEGWKTKYYTKHFLLIKPPL